MQLSESRAVRSSVTPTVIIVNVDGLSCELCEDCDRAVVELEAALYHFTTSLEKTFNNRVLVELITESETEFIIRQKRQVICRMEILEMFFTPYILSVAHKLVAWMQRYAQCEVNFYRNHRDF